MRAVPPRDPPSGRRRANHRYRASRPRWFRGLRPYLICTPAEMPAPRALADPKTGERQDLAAMTDAETGPAAAPPGPTPITGNGFAGRQTEAGLAASGTTTLPPSRNDEQAQHSESLLTAIRQLTESASDTLTSQLDPEPHRGRTYEGVAIRDAQRILTMTTAIWPTTKPASPCDPVPDRPRPMKIIKNYSSR